MAKKGNEMENGASKGKDTAGAGAINYPDGIDVLADLGHGLLVANVDVSLIREQDKNARVMKPEMFRQLAENIKNRGTLESLPLCALIGTKIEVISGHHRLRASKEAGLTMIPVILDTSGLTRSQIAAKQLAHNAINGFDDQSTLKEIAKLITDVDDMIESYIGKDILGEPTAELEKLLSPIVDFDWKQVEFVFLPHQIRDLEALVKKTQGSKDYIGAATIDQYEKLLDTLTKYTAFKNVKNIGAALHSMIECANNEMQSAGFDINEEWIPISRIFGTAAIPKETAETMTAVFKKLIENGDIDNGTKWKAIEVLANNYLEK